MATTIAEYARAEGISVQRARELARAGRISAHKEGRSWMVEGSAVRQPMSRRPLSASSQADLIGYLNTRSLRHAAGSRRARLAERIRELQTTENPAALIREFFSGAPQPEGIGGAAIVRAAMKGFDEQVRQVLRSRHRVIIRSTEDLTRVLLDSRALLGEKKYQSVSEQVLPLPHVRRLERGNRSEVDMLKLQQLFNALGLQVSKVQLPRGASNAE